ncbi:MAG: hypothetical protein H6891_10620 [Brucellaceae bacterium]|nr:hypothetical protein [Brucellaceae bacterium]
MLPRARRRGARDGTFSGYASLFGAVDLGKDAVERGAFAAPCSDARGAAGIRMLFQARSGKKPIGTLADDRRGMRAQPCRLAAASRS